MKTMFKKRVLIITSFIIAIFLFVSCDLLTSTVLVSGTVIDSTTGYGIANVRVLVDGSFVSTSDEDGEYEFQCDVGTHVLEFELTGYFITPYTFVTVEGVPLNISVQNTVISQSLNPGESRIVLTWGQYPSDLDSHLILPDNTEIYYMRKTTTDGYAELDVDDTTSYGPETTTIYQFNSANNYSYYVYNYSRDTSHPFSLSGANVRIYYDDDTYQDVRPPSGDGFYWKVCDITGTTVTITNTVGDSL